MSTFTTFYTVHQSCDCHYSNMFCPISDLFFCLFSPGKCAGANSCVWAMQTVQYSSLFDCLFFCIPFLSKLCTLGVGMVQARRDCLQKVPLPPAESRSWRESDYNKVHRHTMGNSEKCASASSHLHTMQTAQGIHHIVRWYHGPDPLDKPL